MGAQAANGILCGGVKVVKGVFGKDHNCRGDGKGGSGQAGAAYSCYQWTSSDEAKMGNLGLTQKDYCERSLGFVFTNGNDKLAPGCGGCYCCVPPRRKQQPQPQPQPQN